MVTLYPYLTLHLRSLGFDVGDAAAVNTVVPVADVVAPPLAGIVADRIGNFRCVWIFSFIYLGKYKNEVLLRLFMAAVTFLNGASSLLLLVIPRRSQNLEPNTNSTDGVVADEEEEELFCCLGGIGGRLQCLLPELTKNETEPPVSFSIKCQVPSDRGSDNDTAVAEAFLAHSERSDTSCSRLRCKISRGESEDDSGGEPSWLTSFSAYLSVRVLLDVLRASSLMLFEVSLMLLLLLLLLLFLLLLFLSLLLSLWLLLLLLLLLLLFLFLLMLLLLLQPLVLQLLR